MYFDTAWEFREAKRNAAKTARAEGNRHDVKAYVQKNQAYAEQLAPAEVAVAHGAIALEDGEVLYIGRNTIFDDEREPLVINWKTSMGALYERASVLDSCGVARKRTFRTKANQIQDFNDLIFHELAAQVARLTATEVVGLDDALLADLHSGRDGAMRDIVRTIQASQSSLIRHAADALLLIQGGPGTGKSAVALHRASWLLFNEPGLQASRMLVIGPNETFANYIKDVLPGLGDESVPQTNLRALGPQRSSRRQEDTDVARLKGEARMAQLLRRGLEQRARFAGSDPDLQIGNSYPRVALSREEIEDKLEELRSAPTYMGGRASMRDWLTDRVLEILIEAVEFTRGTPEPDAQAIERALDRLWPSLSAQQFLRDLLGSQARLQEAAGDDFTAGDIGRLYRQAAATAAAETWSDSDVALLDEAEWLIQGSPDRYDHIIVDEAQDLSPMQLRSIRRRSSNGRCTIVGDIAQSTGPWSRDNWDDVVTGLQQAAPPVYEELTYGYRVPREVYAEAAKLLPLMAPGLRPLEVVRGAPEPPRFIIDDGDFDLSEEVVEAVQEQSKMGRFFGVIVAPESKQQIAAGLRDCGISFTDADGGSLGTSVNLLSATEAKGLEFDSVIVVEPAAIANVGSRGLRLLYIALTRATKYLTVVYAQAFEPLGLVGATPLIRPSTPEPAPSPAAYRAPYSGQGLEVAPDLTGGPAEAASATARPLSPILAGAARVIAEQIRADVQTDRWTDFLAEIGRALFPQNAAASAADRDAQCQRFHADGTRCTAITTNSDGWCRTPDCAGFFARTPTYGIPAAGETIDEPRLLAIEGSGDAEIFIPGTESIRITLRAASTFALHHSCSEEQANRELRAMLSDFLPVAKQRKTRTGFIAMFHQGFSLIMSPDGTALTGYNALHRDRTWEQVKTGVPSRVASKPRNAWIDPTEPIRTKDEPGIAVPLAQFREVFNPASIRLTGRARAMFAEVNCLPDQRWSEDLDRQIRNALTADGVARERRLENGMFELPTGAAVWLISSDVQAVVGYFAVK
ncbi:AAA family ATPase [Nocardioides sp. TRM66260-LWL]|uniref:UvrD-helicase domain-containing protein n=1 Tax=Nocardioides sp. TRM66260-LWL TaxID=2874478 RepID=UPI001CC80B7E|nr:UvrD-helicase domain-containing protein [Nocardioides sp. TRM66260-LWL]MBZ5733483.1 AAA family ATPase [Nocardioides sp. TRM66260-LWL]